MEPVKHPGSMFEGPSFCDMRGVAAAKHAGQMEMMCLKKEACTAHRWCYHRPHPTANVTKRRIVIISALTLQTGPGTFLHQCYGPLIKYRAAIAWWVSFVCLAWIYLPRVSMLYFLVGANASVDFDVHVTVHRDKFLVTNQLDALISQIYFWMKLYMFQTVAPSTIRSICFCSQSVGKHVGRIPLLCVQ